LNYYLISQKPKLTIGIPIYNGEKFVRNRLDNILSQTFQDFQIIIYDNSNDSTPLICNEYVNRDNRITYIHEKIRPGWIQGWIFLIKKSSSKYFVMASVDDLWSLNFLEENVNELETHSSCVASIGEIKITENSKQSDTSKDNFRTNLFKKLQQKFTHSFLEFFEAKGSFEEKADKILKNTWYRHHNGIIRTDEFKKSILEKDMFLWDWAIILNLIKFGDLHMTRKSSYFVYTGETMSRKGMFQMFKAQKVRKNEYFFPASTFTFWCIKNVGVKFFLKNIDYFIWLNFIHIVGILLAVYHKLVN